ncbi:hypothetical protein JCM24511_03081 [Saitozyma sp. JCM 24511]|nr:hypothetical protein JCM24511_03081 [Saitozyma sp. JCM 24511]
MSDSTAQTVRQLKIKTGVVKRLFKEEKTYRVEAEDQRKVLAKLKDEDADGADIRNAERVLKDSEQMIPRTRKSLEDAVLALQDLVDALAAEPSLSETPEYTAAKSQLEEVDAAWKINGA